MAPRAVDMQLRGDFRFAQREKGQGAALGQRAGIVVGLRDECRRGAGTDLDFGLQLNSLTSALALVIFSKVMS